MSYYSDLDDLQSLNDEVNQRVKLNKKVKPASICTDCPKKGSCHMDNGVRYACSHKRLFIKVKV